MDLHTTTTSVVEPSLSGTKCNEAVESSNNSGSLVKLEQQPRNGPRIYVRTPLDCKEYADGFQDLRDSAGVGKDGIAASMLSLTVEQASDIQVARIYVRTPADCRQYSDSFGDLRDVEVAGDDVDAGGNNFST
ncbi:hypothetical protein H0H92_007797 [Tricholoma furcatifolium]|nr:hypothetical protein H0H92_007797 [Tricholoma furcatifolium]